MLRKTKIVATIGPASEQVEVLTRLIEAGVDVCRLNFSHGTLDEQRRRIENIREAGRRVGKDVAIMIDLKGPEIRIGTFENGKIELRDGDLFTLTTEPCVGNQERVWVQYPGIVHDVVEGGYLLLDDGNLTFQAVEVTPTEIRCRVIVGGVLSDRKKVNLPGTKVSLPALSEKDIEDIRFGVEMGVDFVAGSFIRKAQDVLEIRRVIEEAGGHQQIISKVESQEGFDNLEAILQVSDGLMVARGDLGVEVPTEEVPLMQKRMIERANAMGKPVITATQMLESMVNRPRPTRAEASDVANAIMDGTDAIMLSAESAAGKYPVEAVRTMAMIARRTEEALDHSQLMARRGRFGRMDSVTEAISHATVTTAHDLGATAIVSATTSGFTARMVSKYRPGCPIIAVTPDPRVARQLRLVWGVFPVVEPVASGTEDLTQRAVEGALVSGLVKNGDLVVITAGLPVGVKGTTNLLKVHTVADVLAQGTGIGRQPVTGRAVIVRSEEDLARVQPGDILVSRLTDAEFVPAMERAAGIITEEGGLTSHAAVAGISLGKPVIVGAEGATRRIPDGAIITMDVAHGLVLRGEATVK
ncbi:pyruvate kinase [Symbiobacterium thermophilum]|uniref:pyruvate kinase n=1 Tax=Symbiobacterium thermophilum TaxID=2734 RepID=UPI0035C68E6C